MSNRKTLVQNAAANLVRGLAVGIATMFLPPLLVRHMASSVYSVWILILQTAAYAGYLDFGLQTAIGRYIAFANERKDLDHRDAIYSTASLGLMIVGLLNGLMVLVFVALLRHIFPSVPAGLVPQMRWALLIVGISVALGHQASAWNGVFAGLQRNSIPALTTLGGKLLMITCLIIAVYHGAPLIDLAIIVAATNILAYASQYIALERVDSSYRFNRRLVKASAAKELVGYCIALTVVALSVLLINGVDLLLVGRFDFKAVIPYAVAASIIPVMSGSLNAVMNAIIPHAATLHARGQLAELGRAVLSGTRIGFFLLAFTGLPLLIFASPILRLWIGSQYVAEGQVILRILLIANIIRLTGAAYLVVLTGAGQEKLIKVSPLAEGLTNFTASVLLGATLGAVGVAYGTLIGSVVNIGSNLFYSMPRSKAAIQFSRRSYLLSSVGIPLLCASPLIVEAVLAIYGIPVSILQFASAEVVSLAAAGLSLNHYHRFTTSLPFAR